MADCGELPVRLLGAAAAVGLLTVMGVWAVRRRETDELAATAEAIADALAGRDLTGPAGSAWHDLCDRARRGEWHG